MLKVFSGIAIFVDSVNKVNLSVSNNMLSENTLYKANNYQLLDGYEHDMRNIFRFYHILSTCYNNKTRETRKILAVL